MLTRNKLADMSELLDKKYQKKLPIKLRELSLSHPLLMSGHDYWGERLSYTKLNKKDYLLQSHSYDERKDIWVSNTRSFDRENVYEFKVESALFPGQTLEGVSSPGRSYFSKVYQDENSSKLVVYKKKSNELMTSSHENTKEVVWLDDHIIAYTTNNTGKYNASAFVWNLERNETYNLSEKIKNKIKLKESKTLCLSLSSNLKKETIITAKACEDITTFKSFLIEAISST